MKLPKLKIATRARKLLFRIGVATIVTTALFVGVQAIWILISHHQMLAAAELQNAGATVFWAWRLDPMIMAKQSPRFLAPSWVLPGDGYVVGVYLSNSRCEQLDQKLAALKSCRGIRDLV